MHPLTEKRNNLTEQLKSDIDNYIKATRRHGDRDSIDRRRALMNQTLAFLIETAIEEGIESGKEIAIHDLWERIKNESRTGWLHSLDQIRAQAELKND